MKYPIVIPHDNYAYNRKRISLPGAKANLFSSVRLADTMLFPRGILVIKTLIFCIASAQEAGEFFCCTLNLAIVMIINLVAVFHALCLPTADHMGAHSKQL